MLGLYVSGHPLDGAGQILSAARDTTIRELLSSGRDDGPVKIAGLITAVEQKTTRTGSTWAAVTLEDLDASIEVCFFGGSWMLYGPSLTRDTVISVTGTLSGRGGKTTVSADDISIVDTSRAAAPVIIVLASGQAQETVIRSLRTILQAHPGPVPVHLRVIPAAGSGETLMRCDKFPVTPTPGFWGDVKALLGTGASA
jgi:DNA polymerase-3 subunit alpha